MRDSYHRYIEYAGSAVKIRYSDPRAGEILDAVFYQAAGAPTITPYVTFRIDIGEKYSLFREDVRQFETADRAEFAEMLMSTICRALAEESRGGLLFHAAALSHQGCGILLPGNIGAGKSTFTAWLMALGLDYLSDEMAFFPAGKTTFQPLHRPVHLKAPSRPILASFCDVNLEDECVLHSQRSDLIPPEMINPRTHFPSTDPILGCILFPRYKAESDFEWKALTPAETGLELMQRLVNARNLPGYGFEETAQLARRVPGYKFTYCHFEQVREKIDDLLGSL